MKILRVGFTNLCSFGKDILIDLYAEDKVIAGENVSEVSHPVYSQNVVSFVGINATGKTSVLRLLDMAFKIVINDYGLDQIGEDTKSLLSDHSSMTVDFFNDGFFYRLHSQFGYGSENELIFSQEEVFSVPMNQVRTKKQFASLDYGHSILDRNYYKDNNIPLMLKDSDSIVTAFSRASDCVYSSTLALTNSNFISNFGPVNPLFIKVLDNGIASADVDRDALLSVSFKWNNEEAVVGADEADTLLSSGTIKGNEVLSRILNVLPKGGYLLIDEIENHLNKKLVQLIINLFQDNYTNRNGATLIFSTHYIEILDSLERKDNIYVMKKDDDGRCDMVKYSDVISRNDLKKAEVLLSNMIEGTAPSFEDIQNIKDYICRMQENN